MKNVTIKILSMMIIFAIVSSIAVLSKAVGQSNSVESVHASVENAYGKSVVKPGDKIKIGVVLENHVSGEDIDSSIKIKFGEGKEIALNNDKTEASTNAIEFSYTVKEGDNGVLQIVSTTIETSLGTWDLPSLTEVISADSTLPYIVSVGNIKTGNYKTSDVFELQLVFNEELSSETEAPDLRIKIGQGTEKTMKYSKIEDNKILYTYTIDEQDKGELQIVGASGGKVIDMAGNEVTLSTDLEDNDTGVFINQEGSNAGNTNTSNTPSTNNSANRNGINRGNDSTTSNKALPFAGNSSMIILAITVIALISVFSYMSYKKYKGIK